MYKIKGSFLKLAIIFLPVISLISFVPTKTSQLISESTVTITPSPNPTLTPTPTPTPTLTPSPKPKPSLTPTPFPTVTPLIITSDQLDSWFTNYSNQYSIDRAKLWSIAVCESKLNPNARNGDYAGLYQFSTNTWISTRKNMNLDYNPDIRFNPEEAIKTAAYKISTGGAGAWQNCLK